MLALIENLQPLIEPTITIEADYSSGIKRIFEDHPDIVFMQNSIDNVSCEKPAGQVKALLDKEATRLILLTDEASSWNCLFSAFDQCLDMYQPLDELSLQIQQLLSVLPTDDATRSGSVSTELFNQPESVDVELSISEFEPLGQFCFEPAEDYSWELPAPIGDAAPEVDLPTLAALPEEEPPAFLASFLAGSSIDQLPSFLSAEFHPEITSAPVSPLPPVNAVAPAFPAAGANKPTAVDRQGPNPVFDDLTQESSNKPLAQPAKGGDSRPPQNNSDAPSSSSLPSKKDGPVAGGAKKISPTPAQLSMATAARIGPAPSEVGSHRGIVLGALLIVCICSTALAWFYFGEDISHIAQKSSEASPTSPPKASTTQQLPRFIPQIAPDASYATGHPGWERYQADAVEYLVFREKGGVRAVQVLSEQRGAISAPFLKTCIRTTTGFELSEIKFAKERRDGIEVQTGALSNGMELAIYRNVSDRELRGFVLTFPPREPAGPAPLKIAK